MYRMREAWTDERLDDLNAKVGEGFRRMDERFAQMDLRFDAMQREMNARFDASNAASNARFDAFNARFDAIGERFDAMHRLMIRFCAGMLSTAVAAVVALVAIQL